MVLLALLFSGLLLGLRFGVVELGVSAITLVIVSMVISPSATLPAQITFVFCAVGSIQLGYAAGLFLRALIQSVKDGRRATTWR